MLLYIRKEWWLLKKLLVMLLALAVIFCSCSEAGEKKASKKKEKDDTVIAIVLPMSDREMIYGIQLAVNEINLSGGVGGSQTLVTFLNYENGSLNGIEGLKSLKAMLYINLSSAPVYDLLSDFNPVILSVGSKMKSEASFSFSGFDSEGFEKLFKTKYTTKPNYTTAKAYEMIYMAKQLIEVSNSSSAEDLTAALKSYDNFKGRFHSEVSALWTNEN